jgi:osmotically-inducible protein OsmY
MKRLHFTLAFAAALAVPCAFSQTWDLGKNGTVTQKQTADNKGAKKQSAGDHVNSKSQSKSSTADDDLKQQVNQKFGTDAALRYILVEVKEANVTLSGTVPTKPDKKRAARLAKSVPGVRKVHDSLTVDANASSSNDNEPTNARNHQPPKPKTTASAPAHKGPRAISSDRSAGTTTRIEAGGKSDGPTTGAAGTARSSPADGSLGSNHVGANSTTSGGISGAVASTAGSSASAADPSIGANSAGVTRAVSNDPTPGAIPVPIMRPLASTATLKGEIENALRNDAQVGISNLNVNVTDTTIELSGNVPTAKERTAAYRIAQSFAFNRRVQDRMTVTGRNNAGAIPGANPAAPSENVNPGKPAVGNASTPKTPKSNATAEGNAFTIPHD